jgi:tetratricopeptide (TPR) repeat protein
MRRLRSWLPVLLTLAAMCAPPAAADDAGDCAKATGFDATIAACTRRIEAGGLDRDELTRTYNNRGLAWLRKAGDKRGAAELDSALADFGQSIRLDPKFVEAYLNRSSAWAAKDNIDRAVAELTEAVKVDPDNATAYDRRGILRRNRGDNDAAMADFDQAIRIDPSRGVFYFNRAIAWANKGDRDRSIADYGESIRRPPPPINAYGNRGAALLAKGDLDGAIADFTDGIRLDPKRPFFFDSRGSAWERKGEFDRAIADYTDAISLQPNWTGPLRNRALLYERMGRLDQALADLRSLVQIDPKQVDARERIGRIQSKIAALAPTRPAAPPPAATPPPVSPAPVIVLPPIAGRRVALVIGNGDYRYANKLPNPPNDAADIAAALRKLDFDVVEGRDLDKHAVEDKLREFGRKLNGAKLALFFYAGHGMQVAGKNYIIPVDAKLEQPGDLRLDTIDLSDVLAQMEAEQRVNLVFLDACRDNPLSRSFARSLGTRSAAVGQGLAMVQSGVGTMIAYATQPDAVALDGAGRNSPFTTALLRHIGTPGVDIGAVMRRVRADVIAATNEKQVPWDHSSLVGDVVLAR